MAGEPLEEPTFNFEETGQVRPELFFQFAFDEPIDPVQLPESSFITKTYSHITRYGKEAFIVSFAYVLIFGSIGAMNMGWLKQSPDANNSAMQLSMAPTALLTSFYDPVETETTIAIDAEPEIAPLLETPIERLEIVDETIQEEEIVNKEIEVVEKKMTVLDLKETPPSPLKVIKSSAPRFVLKAPTESPGFEKEKAPVVIPSKKVDYAERDYNIQISNLEYSMQKNKAAAQDKYLLLTFSADWCMPCKIMEETVFQDPQVVKLLDDNFVKMKVDIDNIDGINLKQHFKIERVPTFIMLNKKDEIVGRYARSMSTEKMLKVLSYYQ